MGTLFKNLIIFTFLVISLFSTLNLFQTYYNSEPPQYRKQYETILQSKNYYNGIIFGSSNSAQSIRPKFLHKSGLNFYNYSINGSNPEFHYKRYKLLFKTKKVKPKYCIYGVDFFMFDENWLWRKFEQDVEYFPFSIFVKEFIFNDNISKRDLIFNRFPVLKYRNQISKSLKLVKENSFYNLEDFDSGYISFTGKSLEKTCFKPKLAYNIHSKQIYFFKKLIKLLIKDKVKTIFVFTPEYGIQQSEYFKMYSLKIIESISKEYSIPILNFNTELRSNVNCNKNYFTDWGHMNHLGAKIFTYNLAKQLRKHNL